MNSTFKAFFNGESVVLVVKEFHYALTIEQAQDLSDDLTNAAIDAEEYEDA